MYKFGPLVDSVATTTHSWDAWWMLHRSQHQEELESRPIEVIVCANEAHVMIRHTAANLHHMVGWPAGRNIIHGNWPNTFLAGTDVPNIGQHYPCC